MKIHLKIEGLHQLYKILNKKKALDFEFPGQTIKILRLPWQGNTGAEWIRSSWTKMERLIWDCE